MSVVRVLWMSTHGCFAPLFPLHINVAIRCGAPGVRCRRRQLLPPWSLLLRGGCRQPGVDRWLLGRRPCLNDPCISVCASLLKAKTCLTYVCTQILLLPLTRLLSSFYIRALEAPGL